ncbi:MAG: KOW domain-containing RNA-binding protein [Clostridiales bacterium]|nr:KOW domain-containing RNA-binding protein [Clostridiales bacterium]
MQKDCEPAHFSPGQLVRSKQGRDQGEHYLVMQIKDNILFLTDGRKRGVKNPKKKNARHVQRTLKVAADLGLLWQNGAHVSDENVRESLHSLLRED